MMPPTGAVYVGVGHDKGGRWFWSCVLLSATDAPIEFRVGPFRSWGDAAASSSGLVEALDDRMGPD